MPPITSFIWFFLTESQTCAFSYEIVTLVVPMEFGNRVHEKAIASLRQELMKFQETAEEETGRREYEIQSLKEDLELAHQKGKASEYRTHVLMKKANLHGHRRTVLSLKTYYSAHFPPPLDPYFQRAVWHKAHNRLSGNPPIRQSRGSSANAFKLLLSYLSPVPPPNVRLLFLWTPRTMRWPQKELLGSRLRLRISARK